MEFFLRASSIVTSLNKDLLHINTLMANSVSNRYIMGIIRGNLLSDILSAETGKIPATAALPKNVD